MRTIFVIGGMAAILALSACNGDNETTTTTRQTPARMTDAQMEESVRKALANEPALTDVSVSANAQENKVTLSGKVATAAQRNRAVEIAKSVHTGVTVTDKIDVEPKDVPLSAYTEDMARDARTRAKDTGEKIGDSAKDAWIHTKIVAKLIADKDTPQRKINVDVNNGVVTLRGTVASMDAKREAERIAKETDSVKSVQNRLKVSAGS